MWTQFPHIIEDGTINGHICHSLLTTAEPSNCLFLNTTSSAGKGHPKHSSEITENTNYGIAGQDVYGHDTRSIFIADGHGKEGTAAALAAIDMRHVLNHDPCDIIHSPKQFERSVRNNIVQCLHQAEWEHSGATFVHVSLVVKGSRRWFVTVNVGDSEAFLVYNNNIQVTSEAHNWDNLTMYQRYFGLVPRPCPVCYNRWNASKYTLKDMDGAFRPIMMYENNSKSVVVHQRNAQWVSQLHTQLNKPSIVNGTQSVRVHPDIHENWGSTVLIRGKARGQNMVTFGDCYERSQTLVPMDMVHVYICEISPDAIVHAVVQSDGISNRLKLKHCGASAITSKNAQDYLSQVPAPSDDISVAILVSKPIRK